MEKQPPAPRARSARGSRPRRDGPPREPSVAQTEKDSRPLPAKEAPLASPPDSLAPAFDARLVVEEGDHAGKTFALVRRSATLGRSSKCELPLNGSGGVSRRHCTVQRVGDRFVVIDLQSRNGTLVNGARVARAFLNDRDLIEVGDERVRFLLVPRAGDSADGGEPTPARSGTDVFAAAQVEAAREADRRVDDRPALTVRSGGRHPRGAPRNASASEKADNASRQARARPAAGSPGTEDQPGLAFSSVSARHEGKNPSPRPPIAERPTQLVDASEPLEAVTSEESLPPATASFVVDSAVLAADAERRAEARRGAGASPAENSAAIDAAASRDLTSVVERRPRQSNLGMMLGLGVAVLALIAVLGSAVWEVGFAEQEPSSQLQERAAPSAVEPTVLDDAVESRQPQGASGAEERGATPDRGLPLELHREASGVPPYDVRGTSAEQPKPSAASPDERASGPGKPLPASRSQVRRAVASTASGRVDELRVNVGMRVASGDVVVRLDAGSGHRRKLDALRAEERDFATAAQKGDKAARRDLEAVRADIAAVERLGRPVSVRSGESGLVVEVLVGPGVYVKEGQPLVVLE